MVKTKRKNVLIGLSILVMLMCFVVGLFMLQTYTVYAAEDTESLEESALQFDVTEYEGEKINATYAFSQINDKECSVRITNKSVATTAVIPSSGTINGKEFTVTEIASSCAMSASNLVVVDLPRTVKKIGNMAFANCAKLRSVDLSNVIEIANNAFYRCPQLDLIVIPKTVKSIGSSVFSRNNTQVEVRATESDCVNWTSSWMSGNENQDVHFNSKITTKPRAELIKDNQARSGSDIKGFIITKGQTNLTDLDVLDPNIFISDDIVIPKEATLGGFKYPILGIDDNAYVDAFYENLIIEYSEIPIVIDSNSFIFNTGKNVIFNRPVEFKEIEDSPDYESLYNGESSLEIFSASSINSVILPVDTEIAEGMFTQCAVLENIFFETPSENPYEKGANEKEKLINKLNDLVSQSDNKVEIPESVKTIGSYAFQGAISIKELHITDKTINVGSAIVEEWIPENQTVYVHNENHINYRDSKDEEGWAVNWAGKFTNVIFDKEFYRVKLDVEGGTLPNKSENEFWFEKNYVFTLPIPVYENRDFDAWYDLDSKEKIFSEQIVINRDYNLTALSDIYDLVTIKYKTSISDKTFKEFNLKVFKNILPMFEINYVNVLPPVLDDSQIYVKKEIGYSLNFVIGDDCFYYKSPSANIYSSTTETFFFVEACESNTGIWSFYAIDVVGNKSETVTVYLDCKPPQISLANKMKFGTTVGDDIIVSAFDDIGPAKLYIKFESEEWFSSENNYTISKTERNGKYYFYAEDGNGNRTDINWIILSTEDPVGNLIKSDTDNSRYFFWNNEYWSATLDGEVYLEGTLISNEGQHEIILSNNAFKTKSYSFVIEHCYKIVEKREATCFENGIVRYECSQCKNSYEEVDYTSGHNYIISTIPPTCTEYENITYTCNLCGKKYEKKGNYPTGHSYLETVIAVIVVACPYLIRGIAALVT